jgi:hypothetical protein
VGCASAGETNPDGKLFQPSADPLADVQQFGVPHFYATPTVLIIDPSSGALINDEGRHIWGNAYKAGNAPEDFEASWNALRDFRTAIPDAIRELRDEAQRRVSAGDKDIQLVYPEYEY